MRRSEVLVKDLMKKDVTTLGRNDSLDMAEGLMVLGRIRHVPVLDDDGKVVGIVSSRDLFRSALAFALGYGEKGRSSLLKTVKVKEVMREPVFTIGPDATVAQAALVMVEQKVGCLPVVGDGRMVGIVTQTDLLRHVIATRT